MYSNYKIYLDFLDDKLKKFFAKQEPYIFCHKGCSLCCRQARFPYSLMEVNYLLSGYMKLDAEIQNIIAENVRNILDLKKNCTDKKFLYDCPFLIEDSCSAYEYRGVVCRAFGLMTKDEQGIFNVPFCYEKGLNYSNVVTDDGKSISPEKFVALNIKEEPLGFNVSYKYLTDSEFENCFNFKFGDKKPLIDWLDPELK